MISSMSKHILLLMLIVLNGGVISSACVAQDWWEDEYAPNTLEDPVTAGQESLKELPSAPWVNPETGDLQPIDLKPEVAEPSKRPRKAVPPKPPTNWNWGNWDFSFLSNLGYGFLYLLYAVLALILIGLIVLVVRSIARSTEGGIASNKDYADEISSQVDRVENLPFQLKRPDSDLLSEARRHYNEGNYREAIIYLFSYQLVELDKGQVIRLAKGKTNGQYLREISRRHDLQDILERTMNAFEDVFFGQRDLSKNQFERCWDQVDRFKNLLSGAAS